MELTYIIATKADITQPMLAVCRQKRIADLRPTTDGILAVLGFNGSPAIFDGYTKYTYAEILTELLKDEWTLPQLP